MKFPTSQLTNFTKKPLRIFYTAGDAGTYNTIKKQYLRLRYAYHPDVNIVKDNTFWFNTLVTHKLTTGTTPGFSKYRKGLDDDGNTVLVALVEDLKRQHKITRLGHNLSVLDTNFLRKEKIYAKLKYSRSPQYDIVSGGIAAIFSGFLGFLICEKFGLELLDSGDFYTAFMYGVFIVFACRPLVRVINGFNRDKTYTPTYNPLSPQPLIEFYSNLVKLLFKLFK